MLSELTTNIDATLTYGIKSVSYYMEMDSLNSDPHECSVVRSYFSSYFSFCLYEYLGGCFRRSRNYWSLGSPSVFGGVRVAHRFSFSVLYFAVSCVSIVASVSGLSIVDCLFGFLYSNVYLLSFLYVFAILHQYFVSDN